MIIINGAGIAGLTLANALQIKKMEYVLIEQAEQLNAIGAGILLQNNGLAILDALNLTQHVAGFNVTHMNMGFHQHINTINAKQAGLSCKVVQRCDLQTALMKNIDPSKIRLASHITKKTIHEHHVEVLLNNGQCIKGDYLIDAAGIHSNLISQPELFETNLFCWRKIVSLKKPITHSGEYWFGKQRVGLAPISNTQAYVFHVIKLNKNESANDYSKEKRQAWINEVAHTIQDFKQLQFDDEPWLMHPLQDRKINWGEARLIAIGDAAHAMTPNLGQGAVLSMEDAIELAILLKSDKQPFNKFIKNRHSRISGVHKLSRLFGNIAHNENPILNVLKKMAFQFMPMQMAIKKQVKWMNQFNITLEELKK